MPKLKLGAKPRRYLTTEEKTANRNYDICEECGGIKSKISKRCQACKVKSKKTPVSLEVFYVENEPCRYISLTKGKASIVSESRYKEISKFNWYALKGLSGWYAVCKDKGNTVYMHRQITQGTNQETDHHNQNTLDNRDSNLRPCTHGQNRANSKVRRKTASGYKGVYPNPNSIKNPWKALIDYGGKTRYLGSFSTREDAARAYDLIAMERFGEFAYTNFSSNRNHGGVVPPI